MPNPAEARNPKLRVEAEQRRRVLQVAKGLSATLGSDFFQSLVRHLTSVLHTDFAFLAELAVTPADRIRTLAVARSQGDGQNFEQKLAGTAAAQVLADGAFACSRDVRQIFPLDDFVGVLEAEGYIGLRLSDSAGQAIGLLVTASKSRFANPALMRSVLEAFVPRAALELERKRSEDGHKENEERYQAFISTNPDAMWRIEFDAPVPVSLSEEQQINRILRSGYIAECNQASAELAGFGSVEDLIGCRLDAIAERINPGIREELSAAIHSGFRAASVETAPRDSDGAQVYRLRSQFGIVEGGSLRRIWGTTRDITDLRRTEHSLAASERRFREVLEAVQLPTAILDRTGAVTFVNECFLGLAKRSRQDVLGRNWLVGIIPEGDSGMWETALRADDRRHHSPVHFDGLLIPKDGSPLVISWDTIRLNNPDNSLSGLAAIGRDITMQRSLELEIRQSQKLESIGRLAAGMAHDFNNLLTVILGQNGLLLNQISEAGLARDCVLAIESAAMQCTHLTSELLAFGRKQQIEPQLISLRDVIMGDEKIIRSLIGNDVELVLKLQPSALVSADAAQIRRAIANLVTNARDAMPLGGTLILETSEIQMETEDPLYPGLAPGRYARLSVSDNGIGFTEEIRSHIFEPFFTTKAPGKGTGLGLPTVYGIVTQSGGHIAVHSEPGRGTQFDVFLPVARDSIV